MSSDGCCFAAKSRKRYDIGSDVETDAVRSDRGHWGNQMEGFLATVGYVVGIGNILRFPYLCYRHGGVFVFLIPVILFTFLLAIPIAFMELSIGQYSGLSPLALWWKACPLFKGLGIATTILTTLSLVYLALIPAWSLHYMWTSIIQYPYYPWSTCDKSWNTVNCFTSSELRNFTENHKISPAEEYWSRYLVVSDGSLNLLLTNINFGTVICLLGFWIIVFLVAIAGAKSIGKVGYVTIPLIYLLLLTFLIRGAILPGASGGIEYYCLPSFRKLLDVQTWYDAAVTVIYSTGPVYGGLITIGSYNKFNTCACYRDAILVPIIDIITAVAFGFVVTTFLGYLSFSEGVSFSDVMSSGIGLSFLVMPSVLSSLPLSAVWLALFFLMIILLLLSSMVPVFESVVSGLTDVFKIRPRKFKILVAGMLAVASFLIGLIFTAENGMSYFNILDTVQSYSMIVLLLIEMGAIICLYGSTSLYDDVQKMLRKRLTIVWKIMWFGITPTAVVLVMVFNGIQHYGLLSVAAEILHWLIFVITVLPVPIMMIFTLVTNTRRCIKPEDSWGPQVPVNASDRPSYPMAPSSYTAVTTNPSYTGAVAGQAAYYPSSQYPIYPSYVVNQSSYHPAGPPPRFVAPGQPGGQVKEHPQQHLYPSFDTSTK